MSDESLKMFLFLPQDGGGKKLNDSYIAVKQAFIKDTIAYKTERVSGYGVIFTTKMSAIEVREKLKMKNSKYLLIELTGNVDGRSNILKTDRKSETHQCYGYYWKLLEDKRRNKAVYGIDKKNSGLINAVHYKSIDEAVNTVGTGRSKTGINKSLRNPGIFSWRGYYWYYVK
jgi:hypothetical protein